MSSVVEICNTALITLGANTINSLSESTTEAIACNANWDISRRSVMGLHPWNFAMKRTILAQETTTPVFHFDYQYPLPSDLLLLIKVDGDPDYKKESNRILTNKKTCSIKYVFDNTDTTTWAPLFVDVMVARLAYDLAYTIPRARTMIDVMYQLYNQKLQICKFADASEDISDTFGQFDDSLVGVRY